MLRGSATPPASSAPDAETVRAQLAAILASRRFRRAGNQSALLKHLVERALEGDSAALEERAIGMAVFGRGESFDPDTDGVVRVVTERVRRALHGYYARRGTTVALRIEVPKGGYTPHFTFIRVRPLARRPLFWAALVAALALAGVLVVRWVKGPGEKSVAVTAFQNIMGDPAVDPLIRTIGNHIQGSLERTPGLRVIALPPGRSVGPHRPADAILKGSVLKAGDHIRIDVQLLSGRNGRELWADVYDAPAAALPAMEGDIVWAVGHTLGLPRK